MKVNPEIFRAYDIRGVYGKDFDEDFFYKIAKIFSGRFSRVGKIVVGRDVRSTSESLADSFIKGIVESDFDVLDLGEVTTPMFYFAVGYLKADAGAMITASHNPPEYNGLKFIKGDGAVISGKEIQNEWEN